MNATILVVENDNFLRRLYVMELEADGYQVMATAGGQQALETMSTQPVDLVVMDLVLPDGPGMNYMHQIVELNREVKIIINSAYPIYKMDFRSWAADVFLIKSSDLVELKNTIGEMLSAREN
jgi:DNA-binding response OmpR family regulator